MAFTFLRRVDAHRAELQACTSPGQKFANGTHSWALWTVAPLLRGGWALLGEPSKFVSVSSGRFRAVDSDAASLRVVLEGAAWERITFLVVTPHPVVRTTAANLGPLGRGECLISIGGSSGTTRCHSQ